MAALLEAARLRSAQKCRKCVACLGSDQGERRVYRLLALPCKSWVCPDCARAKAAALGRRALHGFSGQTVRLLTLTIPPQATVGDGLTVINAGFNRLMTRIRRAFPRIMYFKVLEFQKDTLSPHFHLLVNRYIPQAWLARNAEECGLGRICDIRACNPGAARQYVLKYLRKGISNEEALEALLERRGRRYSFSRGFPPLQKAATWWVIHPGFGCRPGFDAALWRLNFYTGLLKKNPGAKSLGPWCVDFDIARRPGPPPVDLHPRELRRPSTRPSHREAVAAISQQHPFTWGVPLGPLAQLGRVA